MKLNHFFALILLLVLGLVVKNLWYEPTKGVHKVAQLERELATEKQNNHELTLKNNQIKTEIESIRYNYDAREELARKHLGLIRKDETFFHITPAKEI